VFKATRNGAAHAAARRVPVPPLSLGPGHASSPSAGVESGRRGWRRANGPGRSSRLKALHVACDGLRALAFVLGNIFRQGCDRTDLKFDVHGIESLCTPEQIHLRKREQTVHAGVASGKR
jgi:hypothetical protein